MFTAATYGPGVLTTTQAHSRRCDPRAADLKAEYRSYSDWDVQASTQISKEDLGDQVTYGKAGILYVNLSQTRVIWEEGTSVEKNAPTGLTYGQAHRCCIFLISD